MSYPNAVSLTASDNTQFNAYTAFPTTEGPHPGIILLQEAFGVKGHIRNVADRLAQAGYVVIAPEVFHRTAAPGLEIPYSDFASAMPHYQAVTPEGVTADVQACYDWLRAQPTVTEKIGSIGFCLGGRLSFLANAVLPLAAGVSYYGGGTHLLKDRAADLHAPHLFFWGGLDQHISKEKIAEVIDAVEAAGKPYLNTVISYADHGFHCDERPSYHPQAAAEAWALTLAFFQEKLR
ncbi:carboxymethylenebutenolidase [Hymenobacter luteus]|uniref:Carboxymethylenebutenolidase n=2 Tax=Hymenobacter TaxID=89966 RepID=A0A7W9WDU5_9BACT|nr:MULTISPECIES: dienelactone hydrolase family protein [Hymenobacter]MBB4601565.1 carboxymethylenebutenolidase [Hymenobacter latericoloratus]MBB6060007.1 carboxymethylenebutenolidase [Hymenobacter luteus]